jgi:hypothetical protein
MPSSWGYGPRSARSRCHLALKHLLSVRLLYSFVRFGRWPRALGSRVSYSPARRGGRKMSDYRIYTLNPEGRITSPPLLISCDTDQAAIERARQLIDQDFELWEGARLVTRIKFLE